MVTKAKCGECGKEMVLKEYQDPQFCGCSNHAMIVGTMDSVQYGGVDLTKVFKWDKKADKFVPIEYTH